MQTVLMQLQLGAVCASVMCSTSLLFVCYTVKGVRMIVVSLFLFEILQHSNADTNRDAPLKYNSAFYQVKNVIYLFICHCRRSTT